MGAKLEHTQQLGLRLSNDLVEWMKTEAIRRAAEVPGSTVNATEVARTVLTAVMIESQRTGASAYEIARKLVAAGASAKKKSTPSKKKPRAR